MMAADHHKSLLATIVPRRGHLSRMFCPCFRDSAVILFSLLSGLMSDVSVSKRFHVEKKLLSIRNYVKNENLYTCAKWLEYVDISFRITDSNPLAFHGTGMLTKRMRSTHSSHVFYSTEVLSSVKARHFNTQPYNRELDIFGKPLNNLKVMRGAYVEYSILLLYFLNYAYFYILEHLSNIFK